MWRARLAKHVAHGTLGGGPTAAPHLPISTAYSYGGGGRGPPCMNPCVSVNHQFCATISKVPTPSPVKVAAKRCIADDPWLESVCSTMLFRHMMCPKEASFPSKWPFHYSIPPFHSSGTFHRFNTSMVGYVDLNQGIPCMSDTRNNVSSMEISSCIVS